MVGRKPANPKGDRKELDITKRQALAALVLAVSGISAIAVPFVLHTPPSAGDNGNTSNNNNDTSETGGSNTPGANNPGQTTPGESNAPTTRGPKTIQDLANSVATCQTDNHGAQRSLQAKVDSAMRAKNSHVKEHHIKMLLHKLETPAAEKHASSCIGSIEAIVNQLA